MPFRVISFDPTKKLCDYSFRKENDKLMYCKKLEGDICPQVSFCKDQDKWVFNKNVHDCPLKRKE